MKFKQYLLEQDDFDWDVTDDSLYDYAYSSWKPAAEQLVNQYNITGHVTYNNDQTVSTTGDVDLSNRGITGQLPLAFKHVGGSFDCCRNKLTSLIGCPTTVGGHFLCLGNLLTSLAGSPKTVGRNFWCSYNNKKFTLDDVYAACDVEGYINV